MLRCAVAAPAELGESPFWHPDERRLYYCDIEGRALCRFDAASGALERFAFDEAVACCAPVQGGGVLLARRSGLWFFEPASGRERRLSAAPYDAASTRYNDGKADPAGHFWCGTAPTPREPPRAWLYRLEAGGTVVPKAGPIGLANGLAWSPDARTAYWSDTTAHVVYAYDFDIASGALSRRRELLRFAKRVPGEALERYGGRPDGTAVDAAGHLWIALYEGARVVEVAPADGRVLREIRLPVRCPTMPCFGGPDLKTLFITTARHGRPPDELAREPLAGCVLALDVGTPGLPVNFARLPA